MKHRFINKKTGVEASVIAMYLDSDGVMQVDSYDAVEDLMDDYAAYEEYTPSKEPLIKDEKVRKAVRVWAEVNSIKKVQYCERANRSLCILTDMGDKDFSIEFVGWIPTLKDGEVHTIAELCGEEEE